MLMKIEDCFYLGYITKTKGLKGEVQVYFEYDEPEELDLDSVFIEISGKLVPFFVSSYRLHNNQTANVLFDDIDHIDKASSLLRKKLYLPLSKKPERDPEEFLISDLKGYLVIDSNAGELGNISEIHEYPQQYIAVVPYRFTEVMI